ncbi:MAG: hypothetical protein DLM60_07975 [Pseudonocardiales bacterium]|nr:MAG: hypothetical protein DLM60_07975 [Pseudonocardiales bacterium]
MKVLDERILGRSEPANDEPAGSTTVVTSTATDNHERPRTWIRRRKDRIAIACGLRLVYTAATGAAALDRFIEFTEAWEQRYPSAIKLWENTWTEFAPFLAFDPEIRSVTPSTRGAVLSRRTDLTRLGDDDDGSRAVRGHHAVR